MSERDKELYDRMLDELDDLFDGKSSGAHTLQLIEQIAPQITDAQIQKLFFDTAAALESSPEVDPLTITDDLRVTIAGLCD